MASPRVANTLSVVGGAVIGAAAALVSSPRRPPEHEAVAPFRPVTEIAHDRATAGPVRVNEALAAVPVAHDEASAIAEADAAATPTSPVQSAATRALVHHAAAPLRPSTPPAHPLNPVTSAVARLPDWPPERSHAPIGSIAASRPDPIAPDKQAVSDASLRCSRGEPLDCLRAAQAWEEGRGVPANVRRARDHMFIGVRIFHERCMSHDAEACWILAGLHHEGHGVPQNDANARALEDRARELCRKHPEPACSRFGIE